MKHLYNFKLIVLLLSLLAMSPALAQNPSQDGQWSDPIGFGLVPVAVANLPDGRLITWSSQFRDTYTGTGDGATFTEIFDPFMGTDGQALGEFTSNTDHDMFCPGINNLVDGRILSAGGTSSTKTSIYDPTTGLWSVASEMNIPRGYQGNVTLADGSVFTVGGSWSDGDSPLTNGGKDAELWTPETGWTLLPGITGEDIYTGNDLAVELGGLYRVDNHVWLWPAPNGRLFHAGPSEMMHWIDIDDGGSINEAGLRGDDTYSMKGTTVMFDIGRILKVGGAESYGSSDPAFVPAKDNSYVIDINNGNNVTVTPTANNLQFSRTMHNSTVLPNGQVLVTGGLDRAEVFSDTGARLTAELYDPSTNSWTNVAGMVTPRTYHSVAILMIDGRVFVGGGGLCDGSNPDECYNHFDAEIYSPSYLFNPDGTLAARPTISAPDTADYNTSIPVTGSSNIQEFSLIRFSAATHSTNNEQRRIPVSFTGGAGSYSISIPDRNLLPPGYYMLFAIDDNGVPSIAEAIQIGTAIPLQNNPNLVLNLEFDEGSGSLVSDSSGNGNHATIVERDDSGNPIPLTQNFLTTDGLFGGAMEMDGLEFDSNSIVEIPYSPSLASIQDEITVMAWVYRDENAMNAGVYSHDYPAIFFGFHNSLYKWEFPTTEGSINCYAGYVPTNQWVHMAATFDGQIARLFANGIEICTQFATGDFILEDTLPFYSAFTVSGFYDVRAQLSDSGITDELDGRIDQLKVYNKALGEEEINTLFEIGQQQDPSVPVCPPGTITAEYRIGTTGDWIVGNTIDAFEGDEIYIRAQVGSGEEYFVTTNEIDSPTFSSVTDLPGHNAFAAYQLDTFVIGGDGLADLSNEGKFVMTTATGCATVIELNVAPSCPPGSDVIYNEYRIDGAWDSGASEIAVDVGTNLMISALPNLDGGGSAINLSITLPDGTVVGDNYEINSVSEANEGLYTMNSDQGCSTVLSVVVNPGSCVPGVSIIPEYTLDGVTQSGSGSITIPEGTDVVLSMLPDGLGLTITLPDGSTVGDNHGLGQVTEANNGTYTFTSSEGCVATLDITVQDTTTCPPGSVVPEYTLDGITQSGAGAITVDEGTDVVLSMLPDGIGLTITLPDGSAVGDNYGLGLVTPSDSGTYTFTSADGCVATLDMTVQGTGSCPPGSIIPEYQLDGVWLSGENDLSVAEGTEVVLSMLPNDIGLTITLPDGSTVGDNYDLGNVTAADNGIYLLTSAEGCQTTINLTVGGAGGCSSGSIIPEYTLNGVTQSGSGPITVEEGTDVVLSMLPDGIGLTITLPDGSTVGDNYSLGQVTVADSGTYVFISSEGCIATLDMTVQGAASCPPGSDAIFNEYRIDGVWDSGASEIAVDEGTNLMISALPNLDAGGSAINISITLPDGSIVPDNYEINSVTGANTGLYTMRSDQGCTTVLSVVVNSPSCVPGVSVIPEYTLDGVTQSGSGAITVDEGTDVVLSMLPDGIGLTITLPDGTTAGDNYSLGQVTVADSGTYTFTSAEGCVSTLDITVQDTTSCPPSSIIPEYILDGVAQSGSSSITIDEGTDVVLSMLPDGVGLTITLPDGSTVGDNHGLGQVTPADSGIYTFTSAEGCVATLNVTVLPSGACPPGSDLIYNEYRINGVWDSGASEITVDLGTNLMISALPNLDAGGSAINISITLPDGSIASDNYEINSLTGADAGLYTMSSDQGCTTVLSVLVSSPSCVPGVSVIPEYILDGVSQSGFGPITVAEGTDVVLSMLPDGVGLTITLPDGSTVGDNHSLGLVTSADSGIYTFTSAEGCVASLDMTIQPASSCPPGSIVPEYQLDGIWLSSENDLVVVEGTDVVFSMLPNDIGLTITLPDGTMVGDNYGLGNVTSADSGAYLLTSAEGCQTTINLTVGGSSGCVTGVSIIPEYTLDGVTQSGFGPITVAEGTDVVLSMLPDSVDLTITLPDGSLVGDNHGLGQVTVADSGTYTFTSAEGCIATLDLTVQGAASCPPGSDAIYNEYRIDGVWGSGASEIAVDEGTNLMISALPNLDAGGSAINISITLPDGSIASDNYEINSVTGADAGLYTMSSDQGCTTVLSVLVNSQGLSTTSRSMGSILVFPNPVGNTQNPSLVLTDYMGEMVDLKVYDAQGRFVMHRVLPNDHVEVFELETTDLSVGTYFLMIQTKDGISTKRMIKY